MCPACFFNAELMFWVTGLSAWVRMGAMKFNRDPKSKHDSARSSMPGNYPASQPRAGQQKYIPQSNPGLHQDMGMVVEKGSRRKPSRARRWLLLLFIIFFVFFTPFRTTILVLGIDSRPGEEWTGRSDTMIITTIPPVLPQVSMLSIPRDLWVGIPGYGENRINTAHFLPKPRSRAADRKLQPRPWKRISGSKYLIRSAFALMDSKRSWMPWAG